MTRLTQFMRRLVIRWQLRNLHQLEQNTVAARDDAKDRLMKIRRERGIKEVELWLFHSAEPR